MSGTPEWVVLAWRLPAGLSTPRVTTWRNLQRLGAARLTPGAAVVPFREDLQEQLDWLAQDIETQGGEAWVLPVTGLSESEERLVRERMAADRDEEYRALEEDAVAFVARRSVSPAPATSAAWMGFPSMCVAPRSPTAAVGAHSRSCSRYTHLTIQRCGT
jgi:hypothetical protein